MVFLEHHRWDFGDGSRCVNHTLVAPLARNDVPLDRTATQIYLQDHAHHVYTTPGKYSEVILQFNVIFTSSKETEQARFVVFRLGHYVTVCTDYVHIHKAIAIVVMTTIVEYSV